MMSYLTKGYRTMSYPKKSRPMRNYPGVNSRTRAGVTAA